MSRSARILLCFAGLSLVVATGLGAYASHGAESALGPLPLQSLRVAIAYQFYNSLGLLAVGTLVERYAAAVLLRVAGYVLVGGIFSFCGAIDAKIFGAPAVVGELAPVGGTALILGWVIFTVAIWRTPRAAQD